MYAFQLIGNASVHAEELLIDETGQGYGVEHLHGLLIGLLTVLSDAYILGVLHYCLKLK